VEFVGDVTFVVFVLFAGAVIFGTTDPTVVLLSHCLEVTLKVPLFGQLKHIPLDKSNMFFGDEQSEQL
jgi:hypothetical protein